MSESSPSNVSNNALLAKTAALSVALIAAMAQVSSPQSSLPSSFIDMSSNNAPLKIIYLFLFTSVVLLALFLIWNPRFLKESADRLCVKHQEIPTHDDAYYVMFLRQFGAYLLFLLYAIYLHPDLALHVWKVMGGGILIKTWHVQSMERPIPLKVHLVEMMLLAFIGVCASLYGRQVIVAVGE